MDAASYCPEQSLKTTEEEEDETVALLLLMRLASRIEIERRFIQSPISGFFYGLVFSGLLTRWI